MSSKLIYILTALIMLAEAVLILSFVPLYNILTRKFRILRAVDLAVVCTLPWDQLLGLSCKSRGGSNRWRNRCLTELTTSSRSTATRIGSIPAYLLRRLQSVLNAAERISVGLLRSAHYHDTCLPIGFVPPNTSSLNWLLWCSAAFKTQLLATLLLTSPDQTRPDDPCKPTERRLRRPVRADGRAEIKPNIHL